MYDLISVGNISIDLYYQGDSLTYKDNRFQLAVGGKYFVDHFHQSVGGGGSNIAIGVQKLGLRTAVFGKIGLNSFKNIILDQFEKAGVGTMLCQYEKDFMNVSSILLTEKGERAIINFNTPHQHLFEDDRLFPKLKKTKAFYLGNLPDVSFTQREKLLHFLHKEQILTIVNLGVKDCKRPIEQIAELLKPVNIVIVNGHEYAELTKHEYSRINFQQNPVQKVAFLKDKIVIVTDGPKGSYGFLNDMYYYQPAEKIESIVDATGAGDGYTAGFIAEYLKTFSVEKAMDKGAKYAAKILSKLGAN